ncbi:MAG: sulfate adenylyltransferase subunit CysN [Bdellovibrionaceae bacterium]|jgi:bifunctional enzyme CysN/CysC|nr:sulfate adenylyltransferase subunit CysN [Pseudobdellovibrionaceae bacterium]
MTTEKNPQNIDEFLDQIGERTLLRFSTAGSVDDGKSTLIGRLLYDSKNVFEDTLASVQNVKSTSVAKGEIDFSLFTDGLKAEREQKITIDVAYRYFSTARRNFILADTPGHVQYTRNMATGASTADAAILLIDAKLGVTEQTRRHAFILSLLGIKHFIVTINKMDLVDYSQKRFDEIYNEFTGFSSRLQVPDIHFIPVSALNGDNVVNHSDAMPWYNGSTVLAHLENLYIKGDRNLIDFRFPIQYVNRPSHDFRGYAGQIVSGVVKVGDEIIALPSLKPNKVKRIQTFDGDLEKAFAPQSVTLILENEIDVSRGDVLVHPNNVPKAATDVEAMLVWMAEESMDLSKTYYMKQLMGSGKCQISKIRYEIDINTYSKKDCSTLQINGIGRVVLTPHHKVFVDSYKKNRKTGAFIIIDQLTNSTVAAGMVLDRTTVKQLEDDKLNDVSGNLFKSLSDITYKERCLRNKHKAKTYWMTGLSGSGKSTLSKEVEKRIFAEGMQVYRLDGDNVRLGLNSNLDFTAQSRKENIRRVAEVAKLMNDAGLVVITSFISPFEDDRKMAKEIIGEEGFFEVFVNTSLETCEQRDTKGLYKKARAKEIPNFTGISSPYEAPVDADLHISTDELSVDDAVSQIVEHILKSC